MIIETNFRAIKVVLLIWKWLIFYLFLSIAVAILYTRYDFNISVSNTEISMLGIALSILMGFRVSAAYERWWEARRIWGAVVNNSRSFARQVITFSHDTGIDEELVKSLVYRQIAFVHAMACRLRQVDSATLIKPLLYSDEFEQIIVKSHIPNLLLLHNTYAVKQLQKDNHITDFELMRIEETLYQLTDNLGGAERIKNTPFPVPYSYFTWLLVHLFAILIPFGMVDAFGYLTIPVALCATFVFLIIDQIAVEIQDPFSNRENDIPVSAISQNIEIDLKEMMGDTNLPQKTTPEGGVLM